MIIEEIKAGESETLELKRCLPGEDRKVLKTFVAFANGGGGRVVFGVDDKTLAFVGVPDENRARLQDSITDMISANCEPQIFPSYTWLVHEGKALLVVSISAGVSPPYFLREKGPYGGTYIRVGATTRKAENDHVRELLLKRSNCTYDAVFESGVAPATDEEIRKLCNDVMSYAGTSAPRMTGVKDLQNWHLLKESRGEYLPSVAFVLLSRGYGYFDRIQCALFKGIDRVHFIDRKEFSGPAYEQLEAAQQFLLRHLNVSSLIEGLHREDVYEIPPTALRELLVNAVIHRNYLEHGCIQISIYDDRVEISSPGGLYDGLTEEEMKNGSSRLRNPVLADVFHRMGIVEKWGTGIHRVIEACKEAGLAEPIYRVTRNNVVVVVPRAVTRKGVATSETELSERELAVMEYVAKHPGVKQKDIVAATGISRSAVSRIVIRLHKMGFLSNESGED